MLKIEINGIVQGVGFRPFVYNLAQRMGLKGYVLNSGNGVELEVEGDAKGLKVFVEHLKRDIPVAARIDQFTVSELPDNDYTSFQIYKSVDNEGLTFISPDLAVCSDCLEDFINPHNLRFRYPFITCTNCGPRYSIIEKTPYDRPLTSMKEFQMCDYCSGEYHSPSNRRFHAQPIACPECGPKFIFLDNKLQPVDGDPLKNCLQAIKEGKIVGIKGIGGFHLACDAANVDAVQELRRRKLRPHKPFAVMCSDVNVKNIVDCTDRQLQLLKSPAAPVVLLPKTKNSPIVEAVAPLNPNIGVFLPYAPHHYQLLSVPLSPFHLSTFPPYLVMTSANIHDDPIAIDEKELNGLCDYFLTHNRRILNRCDDSVIMPLNKGSVFFRRSRGYVPTPLILPEETIPTLGVGAELKISFALTDKKQAYLSPYIGNNNSKATEDFYNETLTKFQEWFKIYPKLAACDLHPDYMTTRYAESLNIPVVKVQHHHAHIAAVMADNNLDEKVIGVSYDGTGYGEDGAIWGGEVFVADYFEYSRRFHLKYMPLPGGDAAVTHPIRTTYAYLLTAGEETGFLTSISENEKKIINKQIENNLNTFSTSSMGRLFDCIAAMIGLFPVITFEAQSAMALEFLCNEDSLDGISAYSYEINDKVIDVIPLLNEVKKDFLNGVTKKTIALRFHKTIIDLTVDSVSQIVAETDLKKVVLSGGVMQNKFLLEGLIKELRSKGLEVFYPIKLPANDGAIAVGQVMIANKVSKVIGWKGEKVIR